MQPGYFERPCERVSIHALSHSISRAMRTRVMEKGLPQRAGVGGWSDALEASSTTQSALIKNRCPRRKAGKVRIRSTALHFPSPQKVCVQPVSGRSLLDGRDAAKTALLPAGLGFEAADEP